MKMLEVVADLSVNTSHPLFLNQLFGAMDRASLAAELMSVCQNTSSYTFEAAPANSVVEMEVRGWLTTREAPRSAREATHAKKNQFQLT